MTQLINIKSVTVVVRTVFLVFTIGLGFLLNSGHAEAKCSKELPLTFADFSWDSAKLHTSIASFIAQYGYGCSVSTEEGDTLVSLERISNGKIDVIMEVWKDNIVEDWMNADESGQIIDAGINFSNASQGWYVPSYMISGDKKRGIEAVAPDLKSLDDLKRYGKFFISPQKNAPAQFLNCPKGWACAAINSKKLKIYGLEEKFKNIYPESGKDLDDLIIERYNKGLPFLAYYWTPTWIVGAYNLIRLAEPAYDENIWQKLVNSETPKNATEYPTSTILKGVNFSVELDAPQLMKFLRRYNLSVQILGELLAIRKAKNISIDDTAKYFLVNYPTIWHSWVSKEALPRIQEKL
jgi:glycine betaine/proline transport system substrate-binding protein